jgi:hypothetical protein
MRFALLSKLNDNVSVVAKVFFFNKSLRLIMISKDK